MPSIIDCPKRPRVRARRAVSAADPRACAAHPRRNVIAIPTAIVIPARLQSSRLLRKVLADIHGHPMLWHVFQRASSRTRAPVRSGSAVETFRADSRVMLRLSAWKGVTRSGMHSGLSAKTSGT